MSALAQPAERQPTWAERRICKYFGWALDPLCHPSGMTHQALDWLHPSRSDFMNAMWEARHPSLGNLASIPMDPIVKVSMCRYR